nr:ankyrin repeat-containing protein [Cedratvirus duvanny]
MQSLPEELLVLIFSFSEGYNFVNRQVCFDFRRMIKPVDHLVYLDQLLKDNRKPDNFQPSKELAKIALDRGLLHLLQACKEFVSKSVCTIAAKNGYLEILQWAGANGYSWDEITCSAAAYDGHLEVLQWLRANGCPWDKNTCSASALYGHLEVLQWARNNGCPWDENTCTYAAYNGHLEVLQWLRNNGCPWDENTCVNASENGHLEVLKWAKANGCPYNRMDSCLCF